MGAMRAYPTRRYRRLGSYITSGFPVPTVSARVGNYLMWGVPALPKGQPGPPRTLGDLGQTDTLDTSNVLGTGLSLTTILLIGGGLLLVGSLAGYVGRPAAQRAGRKAKRTVTSHPGVFGTIGVGGVVVGGLAGVLAIKAGVI